jgi:predicted dehydrogenase
MDVPAVPTNYERFAGAVRAGRNQQPDFRHAAELQRVLDLAMASDIEHKELATH